MIVSNGGMCMAIWLIFFVKLAWESLRPRGDEVSWYKTVWFTHCIPQHAFHLWIVMRRCLKTQDMLRPWDVGPSVDISSLRCVFCQNHMDSHEHLFFECSFAAKIWSLVRVYAEMESVRPLLHDITNCTIPIWVKLHDVPITAFSEDGLSVIATKLGTPLMLDSYTSDMCMQSWGRSSYARVMIELRADVELKDNIVVAMPKIIGEGFIINTGVGEKKTLRKPSQTSRGVPVGPKIGFKPQKEYRHVPKKLLLALAIIRRKMWYLLLSGKATLVDEVDNPLKKVEFSDDYDNADEVASVDNDIAHSMASERVGFGTQSLLEQCRDSYGNGDYDDDTYDDDMYEGQDLPQELQAICDNLDIRGSFALKVLLNYVYSIHMDADRSLHARDEDEGSCIIMAGLRKGAAWNMSYSLGLIFMEVSYEAIWKMLLKTSFFIKTKTILALHLPLCPSRVIRTIDDFEGIWIANMAKAMWGGGVKDGEVFGGLLGSQRGDKGGV
ncbi:retrotransposon protein, putative, ty1-copia subclass [Tanacetum coccineum]